MEKVVSLQKLIRILKNYSRQGKKIVLAGGCFDILHPGHVVFLQKAKRVGDILVVLLESDRKIMELKGSSRPVFTQKERAKVLSALEDVDYVLMLPYLKSDAEYDDVISQIKPDMITATAGNINIHHYKRSAKLAGAKLKFVTKIVGNYSTSRFLGRCVVK